MKGSPFPQGFRLPDGVQLGRATFTCDEVAWIHVTKDGRRAVIVAEPSSLIGDDELEWFHLTYSGTGYRFILATGVVESVSKLPRPLSANAAMAFARALSRVSGTIEEAIFVEEYEAFVMLASESTQRKNKAEVLGAYLTGGVDISADDVVALQKIVPMVTEEQISNLLDIAGIAPKTPVDLGRKASAKPRTRLHNSQNAKQLAPFALPGRRELSAFFNEHVVDIVADEERYAAMGIGFPGGIILEGPTGCGKTYAVERLVEHLGWPSFSIEASSVASPYIHETSRKVAEIFSEAMKAAPAVVIIDEMDAFLASRDSGSHQHNVEEIAEFLRRIPEASANRVLVIGMTNQIDAIDSAILRRGRFDHVIHVDHAGADEVAGLLEALLENIPNNVTDVRGLAQKLSDRPLSDAAFVVREAGRLAAKERKDRVGDEEIGTALARCPSRNPEDRQRIGF